MYYESHVTIDPETEDHRVGLLHSICEDWGFRVAELYMKKGATLEPSDVDMFMTGRNVGCLRMHNKMFKLLQALRKHDFKIRRYKIELAVLDSREDDPWGYVNSDSRG